MKSLLLVVLVLIGVRAIAQDPSKTELMWTTSSIKNPATGVLAPFAGTFNSGPNQIVWVQKGTYTRTFTVVSIDGSWSNVNVTGSIVFNVKEGGDSGKITFSRGAAGALVLLDLGDGNGYRVNQTHVVQTVLKAN